MGAEIGNSIVLPEFWPFPGRLGLSKYLLHCEVFYGASPFRNELCPERWWGDDDVHSVGAGKGQCTVTNGSGLFSHVLPLLHCEQRKGYAVSHL